MMKSFLLLILSLMAGCEDASDVEGCTGGWVEFTCKYPKTNERYESINVINPSQRPIHSTNRGRFSVYHDTRKKNVRVIIKQLQHQDFGKYKCKFKPDQSSESDEEDEVKVKVVAGKNRCQEPFMQTAYRAAKTTITCDYKRNKADSMFLCKDNGSVCDVILSTKPSLRSDGTFRPTETTSSFNMSISDVSPQHAGVYWCGLETNEGSYRAALAEIRLKVEDISVFRRSPTIGQNLTYWCRYPEGALKFICKGEDPSTCERLVNTTQRSAGRFSMEDDREKRNITITVMNVTAEDTGTYWCGAQSTDSRRSNPFFHKLEMIVVPPITSTPSIISSPSPQPVTTSSVSSTQSSTASAVIHNEGVSWLPVTIAVVVCVVMLVLLLILVLGYKRFQRKMRRREEDGGAQNNEDRAYEEIQERPPKPGSGTALKTIYATANAPTNPSASHFYSTVNFPHSPGEASGETYSTVRGNDQCPTYSTVNPPSRLPEDPFYSTVNNPQQH